jgi:hypothetical protein
VKFAADEHCALLIAIASIFFSRRNRQCSCGFRALRIKFRAKVEGQGLHSRFSSAIKEKSARGIIVASGCGMFLNPAGEVGI